MILEELSGKHFFVTGGTGFLGTALTERILNAVPGAKVTLLIRPGRRSSPLDRAQREIIRNDAFNAMRARLGEQFEAYIEHHLDAVAGDVSKPALGLDDVGLHALAMADFIVHSAATVSFDSPITQAVSVNLLGPSNVAAAIKKACAISGTKPASKHFITVSTSYVAGYRRGLSPESLLRDTAFSPIPNYRREIDIANELSMQADLASRSQEMLSELAHQAKKELGAAGSPLLAQRLEKLREEWVERRLIDQGRTRAQSLGWPDAYTYTKALGEEALADEHSDLSISIVRPSIIESSMFFPYPGWIKGFRMAEPIIISYARGLLKEFPGVPEGIVDVIPVDFVTSSILAVAANHKPKVGDLKVYQVASGSLNPLRYKRLVEFVRNWFTENPIYDNDGQPISVPEWSFPGRGRVQKQLSRASKNLELIDNIVSNLPLRGKHAELVTDIESKKQIVDRALSYVELYGSYAETEAIFDVSNLMLLWSRLDDTEKTIFPFDPKIIDWDYFVTKIHLPSIVRHARVKTTPDKKAPAPKVSKATKAILDSEFKVAVFDLENTVVASNVVDAYAWYATKRLSLPKKALFSFALLSEAPRLISLDRSDRGDFLRSFYRRYENADQEILLSQSYELFNEYLLKKAFPKAIERIRRHRQLGHKTVLITGALDFVVAPIKPLFDEIVACTMTVGANGRLTGNLDVAPPTGEARALLVESFARKYGVTVKQTVAYADSTSDLPMLEAVGHPVVVNPEPKLLQIAKKRGWPIENWERQSGYSKILLPIARSR